MPINSFLYPGPTNSNPYAVDNSCRFNDDDSACLNRSNGSSPSSQRIFTFSAWVKRGNLGSNNQTLMCIQDTGDGDPRVRCAFRDDDKLYFDVTASDGSGDFNVRTTRVFRDVGAWYHFVFRIDTTQSTAADRVKMYVNGSQITSFSTTTYGSQNYDMPTDLDEINIGTLDNNSRTNFFDGYLAEVVYCDGQSLAPSSFGEYDEDSPTIWKPKDVSGLTFGTNGFYLDFEDSANLGNDKNGGTDFTANNLAATDQATDTPTNNFCTLNPLYNAYVDPTFSEGNLKITQSSAWAGAKATMGVSKGKWYWEVKISTTLADHHHGVQQENVDENAQNPQNTTGTTVFFNSDGGEMKSDSTATTADYGTLDNGDILGIALDMDAGSYGQITIFDNGSAIVSDFNLVSSSTTVMPFASIGNSTAEYNFGNPTFSISSSNSDANGYGSFEHSVPSGHYSLCTKNLAEFGG